MSAGIPRTQALIEFHTPTAAGNISWTCPAGHITIVKSFHAYNSSATAVSINMDVIPSGGQFQLYGSIQTVQPNTHFEWNGWIVLNPGDIVQVVTGGAGACAWVSGAVLVGSPTFPASVG